MNLSMSRSVGWVVGVSLVAASTMLVGCAALVVNTIEIVVHTPVVRLHTSIPDTDPLSVITPPIVSPVPLLAGVCVCGVSTASVASTV